MLVLQSLRGLSLEATETMVRDRMTWLHFCGLELNETVPDANTLWDFREALIKAGVLDELFKEINQIIAEAGFISRSGQIVTDAAANDGKRLREGLDRGNTCGDVCGDRGYRSAENERWLKEHGLNSRIHRKKPHKRPMPARIAKANGRKSKDRAKVEHVFAHQKARMRLAVRTVGLARAKAAVTMANIAYDMGRLRWLLAQAKPPPNGLVSA